MSDHVAFEFAGHELTGTVEDSFLEATFGHEPQWILRVTTASGSSYHIPERDASPV